MKIKDERIIQLNNKIQKEAYVFVMFLTIASLCIKAYVMDVHYTEYVTELVILILSTVYISVRGMFLGYTSENQRKYGKVLKAAAVLIISIAISIINGIKNYKLYQAQYSGIFDIRFLFVMVFTFVSSAILLFVVMSVLGWLDRAGQKRIERKLNMEEDEI